MAIDTKTLPLVLPAQGGRGNLLSTAPRSQSPLTRARESTLEPSNIQKFNIIKTTWIRDCFLWQQAIELHGKGNNTEL